MAGVSFLCTTKLMLTLFILSGITLAIIISLERAPPKGHVYRYHSTGYFRECAKWDDLNRRFIVSHVEGGVGVIKVDDDDDGDDVLDEIVAVDDGDVAGNATLGMAIDKERNRVLVVIADMFGNSYSALAAYDLSSWQRFFLSHLSRPGDPKSFADDVAVDEEGNAYVTDAKGSMLWKLNVNGELLGTIKSPLFTPKEWYKNLVGLNGIVYHPDGYLLVIHTFSGNLYKIELNNNKGVVNNSDHMVKLVSLNGSLKFGDGLTLLSPTKLVVAGNPSGRLVESVDGWETASVVGKFWGPMHRLATSATVKDGKAYLSHMIGFGYPNKKHVLVEAIFAS